MRALFGKEYEMTIEEAVCYLKKQDLAALEVGTYQVNDDFYFMIQEYETKIIKIMRTDVILLIIVMQIFSGSFPVRRRSTQ